ncbi:MAG: hypothetical protein JJE46_14375 [Acidimicrobiia bacterium]|nr:hypothetical protein [Acidimicrobiia bacterium]
MPKTPDFTRLLSAGVEFVALTRAQARDRAAELVGQGQLAQSQMQAFVDDLVDESRRRTDTMMDLVRSEIGRQVKTLGIATKDDLAKLEAKLTASPRGAATKAPAKKTAAKKTAKKTAAKKAVKKTAPATATPSPASPAS